MTAFHKVIKIVLWLVSLVSMYIASGLWIGTKDDWDTQVKNHFVEFFVSRFLLVLIVGAVFFILGLLVDWLSGKRTPFLRKIHLIEFLALLFAAALIVLVSLTK